MSPLQTARFYAERLRASPYAFAAHLLADEPDVLVIGGVLERVQAALVARRARVHGARDIINAPPGAGSWMETIAQPVWRLGNDPRIQIEVITRPDAADLARALIAHPDYAQIFPAVELAPPDDPSVLQTTAGGRIVYRTLSERSVDIRPKLLVIDTPQTRAYIAMPTVRDAAFAQVQAACAHLAPTGSVVVVTHRLHADDVTGRLAAQKLGKGRYTVWPFPVIAQDDVIYQWGDQGLKVRQGDLLDPIAWNPARIAELQRLLSPAAFAAGYLQAPMATPDR